MNTTVTRNNRGVSDRRRLLIAGLQRTGTNFVQELVNRNMKRAKVDWPGIWWKHDVRLVPPDVMEKHHVSGIILVIKNPYTWAESICHRFPADISNPKYNRAYEIRSSGHVINGINLGNLMRLYRDFYTNWLEAPDMIFVHYEDLLRPDGRQRLFDLIRQEFSISESIDHIRVPRKVPFTLKANMGSLANYRAEHAPLLTTEDMRLINKRLRSDFFQHIGYQRIKV